MTPKDEVTKPNAVKCVGFPLCDGDLPGEEHEPSCPAYAEPESVAVAPPCPICGSTEKGHPVCLRPEPSSPSVAQGLRASILEMMKLRGWSTSWIHRSAYLHLEAAELAEAVRGKHGDPLKESADVLITLLALSPFSLEEIVPEAVRIVSELRTKPRYESEAGTWTDAAALAPTQPQPSAELEEARQQIEGLRKQYNSLAEVHKGFLKQVRKCGVKVELYSLALQTDLVNERAESAEKQLAEARAQAFKEAGDIASTIRIFTNDDCHAVMSRIVSALYGRASEAQKPLSADTGQKLSRD